VAAYKLQILGEGHVTLENSSAHADGCPVGLFRVLWKLQGSTTVADRKISLVERAVGTLLEGRFEFTLLHLFD